MNVKKRVYATTSELLDTKMNELDNMHELLKSCESFLHPNILLKSITEEISAKSFQDKLFQPPAKKSSCIIF
jgi:hypothetical protein